MSNSQPGQTDGRQHSQPGQTDGGQSPIHPQSQITHKMSLGFVSRHRDHHNSQLKRTAPWYRKNRAISPDIPAWYNSIIITITNPRYSCFILDLSTGCQTKTGTDYTSALAKTLPKLNTIAYIPVTCVDNTTALPKLSNKAYNPVTRVNNITGSRTFVKLNKSLSSNMSKQSRFCTHAIMKIHNTSLIFHFKNISSCQVQTYIPVILKLFLSKTN